MPPAQARDISVKERKEKEEGKGALPASIKERRTPKASSPP
jgi:hypothetical protein